MTGGEVAGDRWFGGRCSDDGVASMSPCIGLNLKETNAQNVYLCPVNSI